MQDTVRWIIAMDNFAPGEIWFNDDVEYLIIHGISAISLRMTNRVQTGDRMQAKQGIF